MPSLPGLSSFWRVRQAVSTSSPLLCYGRLRMFASPLPGSMFAGQQTLAADVGQLNARIQQLEHGQEARLAQHETEILSKVQTIWGIKGQYRSIHDQTPWPKTNSGLPGPMQEQHLFLVEVAEMFNQLQERQRAWFATRLRDVIPPAIVDHLNQVNPGGWELSKPEDLDSYGPVLEEASAVLHRLQARMLTLRLAVVEGSDFNCAKEFVEGRADLSPAQQSAFLSHIKQYRSLKDAKSSGQKSQQQQQHQGKGNKRLSPDGKGKGGGKKQK